MPRGDRSHFAARREQNPGLWNGRVLLAHEASVQQDNLRFSFLETDFASFLAWWDWDFPDHTVFNCFAMGAIRSADGAFLLGQMGPHTAKPGRIYFPAGSPEPGDITNGEVDLVGNMFRELEEETDSHARFSSLSQFGQQFWTDRSPRSSGCLTLRKRPPNCAAYPCAPEKPGEAGTRRCPHRAQPLGPEPDDARIRACLSSTTGWIEFIGQNRGGAGVRARWSALHKNEAHPRL